MPIIAPGKDFLPPRHRKGGAGKRNPGEYFVEVMSTLAIALIARFHTPTSCRLHAGTPQNFKTHAEDL